MQQLQDNPDKPSIGDPAAALSLGTLFRLISKDVVPSIGATPFDADILKTLAVQKGERVLDIGCRDGSVSFMIQAMGAKVTGIDILQDRLDLARAKGIDAQLQDAETMFFDNEFDAAFSHASLHWMRRPGTVISRAYDALKQGGRFVGSFSGAGNASNVIEAFAQVLSDKNSDIADITYLLPWYLPTAQDYYKRLVAGGFTVEFCDTKIDDTAVSSGLLTARQFLPLFSEIVPKQNENMVVEKVAQKLGENPKIHHVTIIFKAVK